MICETDSARGYLYCNTGKLLVTPEHQYELVSNTDKHTPHVHVQTRTESWTLSRLSLPRCTIASTRIAMSQRAR